MFLDKAIRYTQLTMEDSKDVHVLPELLISKEVWRITAENITLPVQESKLADIIRHTNIFCSAPARRMCEN